MAFPSSPADGATTTINGVTYTYSSASGTWSKTTSGSSTLASSVSGTLGVTGATTLSSTLGVTGAATLSNTLGVSGATTLSSTLAVTGATTLSSTLNVTGVTSISANTTVTGSFQANSIGVGTTANATIGQITATNSITAFYSDKRLKDNFVPITEPLNRVQKLTGLFYTQSELAEKYGYHDYSRQVGVIAQDVEAVLPEAVKIAPFDMDGMGGSRTGERYLTIQYEKLTPLLVEAVKELQAKVNNLENEINKLKGQ